MGADDDRWQPTRYGPRHYVGPAPTPMTDQWILRASFPALMAWAGIDRKKLERIRRVKKFKPGWTARQRRDNIRKRR